MDFETIKAGLSQAIPFNGHVGLDLLEVGDGRGVVKLPDAPELKNHVGSQHAGALFSAGEFASGGAFVGAFAEHLASMTPLARSAEIEYRKIAKGDITATATLTEDKEALLGRLDADGRMEFPIDVELTDADGQVVAAMTVHWHVRRNA